MLPAVLMMLLDQNDERAGDVPTLSHVLAWSAI
jgi:hypothetical protein